MVQCALSTFGKFFAKLYSDDHNGDIVFTIANFMQQNLYLYYIICLMHTGPVHTTIVYIFISVGTGMQFYILVKASIIFYPHPKPRHKRAFMVQERD